MICRSFLHDLNALKKLKKFLKIHKLRTEYEGMKVESLSRLQELLNKVKWIDDKILEVNIHISKIFHVIEKSVLHILPPVVVRKEKRLSSKEVRNIVPVVSGSQLSFLASHSVQIGGANLEDDNYQSGDNYLCVILD